MFIHCANDYRKWTLPFRRTASSDGFSITAAELSLDEEIVPIVARFGSAMSDSQSMRAACRFRYGPPGMIQVTEVDVPAPSPDEILIRVHAASVSRTDCALLTARPFIMRFSTGLRVPRRPILGTDFAGQVEAVGAAVREFAVGDDVWGINDLGAGSHAEYLTIAASRSVMRIPPGVTYEAAAAGIEGSWYAFSILDRADFKKGGRVLINGATGAIGSALLQMCVHRGADVTAVGGTKNLGLLESLGAKRTIDYERSDFTKDGQLYDYIFDAVGKSTFGACKPLLTPTGVYVSSELGPRSENLFLALATLRSTRRRVVFPVPIDKKRFLSAFGSLISEGHVQPVVDRTFCLDEIQEAYSYAGSGHKTGSVLLSLGDPTKRVDGTG